MQGSTLVITILVLATIAYYAGRRRAFAVAEGKLRNLHSLPIYYGLYTAIWCAAPSLLIAAVWLALEPTLIAKIVLAGLPDNIRQFDESRLTLVFNDIRNLVHGNATSAHADADLLEAAERYKNLTAASHAILTVVVLSVATALGWLALTKIKPHQRARNTVETILVVFLNICSGIAIVTTIGIVLSVLFESIRFFQSVPVTDFLFGLKWSPQTAVRTGQIGASGAFGMVPLIAGTLLITLVAMLVAVPVGLLSAIYLAEYASKKFRAIAKPLLEILAGVPTVVYGFFAALTVAPFIRDAGQALGLNVASESALAAGMVMGIMIIPFVSSLSDDVINAVPQAMRDGAYALGATPSETIRRVIFPAALPGIVGGVLLAVSRAIGETMIVVMAAGLAANITANPLEAVTTVTVQIVTLLTGDQEFDSPKTLAAFALGLVLFIITLALNVIALHVVRKYREQYE